MHPFARARERTRALNAAKMTRMFAKPFVAALEGHMDAVEVITKKPGDLITVASGSWDGGAYSVQRPDQMLIYAGLIVHNISTRSYILNLPQAHKGKLSGITFADDSRILSCGVDRTVKLWNIRSQDVCYLHSALALAYDNARKLQAWSFQENHHSSASFA